MEIDKLPGRANLDIPHGVLGAPGDVQTYVHAVLPGDLVSKARALADSTAGVEQVASRVVCPACTHEAQYTPTRRELPGEFTLY